MQLQGTSIIGNQRATPSGKRMRAYDPSLGQSIEPDFFCTSSADVERSVRLASRGFTQFSRLDKKIRATFLRNIAANLEALGEILVERASIECGLSAERVRSERLRMCSQLRFLAAIVDEGSWVDARIDTADPTRTPVAKPDVRSMLKPLGPVAVFCASNFPLAFSVAGGDTASALAAGNPVVVLAHYSHPGTAELAGSAIQNAASGLGLPDGVFSLLFDSAHEVARALVQHSEIKGVGFTGSRSGGTALLALANSRSEPIPFFAEMSSVNPVFVLPNALASRSDVLAKDLHVSATSGVGQFCTNPGVVITLGDSESFTSKFANLMTGTPLGVMLNRNIREAYRRGISERVENIPLIAAAKGRSPAESEGPCAVGATVFQTDAATFVQHPALQAEIFGPSTLLVRASNGDDLVNIANSLEGNLTATILGDEDDLQDFSDLVAILEQKVGRLIFNGFPTGVEVCEAMVHGGPFPATSDVRTTSVGGRALLRFTKPFCYQNFPKAGLPPELQDGNPLRIRRLENGRFVI